MPGRFAAAFIASLVLVACDRTPDVQPSPTPAPLEGEALGDDESNEASAPEQAGPVPVELTITAVQGAGRRGTRIAPGRVPTQLYALVVDADDNVLDVPVTWHSLDPERVEVDALGRLTALGPLGPAFVTASAGDLLAEPLPIYVVSIEQLPESEDGQRNGGRPSEGSAEGSAEGRALPSNPEP